MRPTLSFGVFGLTILATAGRAVGKSTFSLDSDESTKEAASTIAWDMLQYYHGNETGKIPGLLPGPPPSGDYFWYNGAVMWAALIEYWHYTGDSAYNQLTLQGLQFQTGDRDDYMPSNYTVSMGNDDQGLWAMAAMLAAERKFPDPPSKQPQWLDLARNVFDEMANPERWDDKCGGGLRWQIIPSNKGYDYKNSISSGILFNLGARLARYTGNKTYAEWAEKSWDWMEKVAFIDNETYAVYDGAYASGNCKDVNRAEFSYVNAIFTLGAAYMYNYTDGGSKWQNRVTKLVVHGLATFFKDDVAFETACEGPEACTTEMLMLKGLLHQWYTTTIQVAPFTASKIFPVLKTSAKAAVSQCTGGDESRQCGFSWVNGTYDGNTGANQEISVLSAVSGLLVKAAAAPYTAESGGSPQGGSGNGTGEDGANDGNGSSEGGKGDESAGYAAGPYANTLSAITLCLAFFVANIAL